MESQVSQPAPLEVIGEEAWFAEQKNKQTNQAEVKYQEGCGFHRVNLRYQSFFVLNIISGASF